MWFIGVEVEQEMSAPPPNKNPGSAPDLWLVNEDSEKEVEIWKNDVDLQTVQTCQI